MDYDHPQPPAPDGEDKPQWQKDAETLAENVRAEILAEIKDEYRGSAELFVHERFGEESRLQVRSIARQTFDKDPKGDFKQFYNEFLLRFAVNSESYRRIADANGFYPIENPDVNMKAVGDEAIAARTLSGSMFFTSPGAFTGTGDYDYLPFSGREVQPRHGNGRVEPGRIIGGTRRDPEATKYSGYLPKNGDMLFFGSANAHTSPLTEVRVKVGGTAQDAQAFMHSMTTMSGRW